MSSQMTPIIEVEVQVQVQDMTMLASHNPIIECPTGISPQLKNTFIFTQWFLTISPARSVEEMANYELLTHFDTYLTYINSKKCKAIRKVKATFPTVEYAVKEKKTKKVVEDVIGPDGEVIVPEKKKRVYKKKEDVIGPDGEVIVPEKKKRVYKKKEVNVEVEVSDVEISDVEVSDVEVSDVVVSDVVPEKKKRVFKKKEDVIGPDGEVIVPEKKKRVIKKKETNVVETPDVSSDEVIVPEKKKRVIKKKEAFVEVVMEENVLDDMIQDMEMEMEE